MVTIARLVGFRWGAGKPACVIPDIAAARWGVVLLRTEPKNSHRTS